HELSKKMNPASRVGDFHVCPQVTPGTPPIPHAGGPVLPPGCTTVLHGGQPAARVADMELCVGPPDAISKGAVTTLIGGMPSARMLDSSLHQGMLLQGLPTVLIGDAPPNVTVVQRGNCFIIVDRDHKKIYMVGVQEFSGDGADQAFVDRAIKSINKTWSG